MLARKAIQDISVIDLNGDIDFREMIRIKDAIGSLIEKERIKVVINLKSVRSYQLPEHRRSLGAAEAAQKFKWRSQARGHESLLA
jgi:MFS superfamily sulfate permease-like transporter